jgi:hypothetical protein
MTAIAACHVCGIEPLENARFCHGCGAPIAEEDDPLSERHVNFGNAFDKA